MTCCDPMPDHCQCGYCRGGVRHASDCAVHNIPAVAIGGCTCGAETGTKVTHIPDFGPVPLDPVDATSTFQMAVDAAGTTQASRPRENELPGMTVGFFVPGQPVAKGRPIAGRGFGGRVTLRTPGKTLAYEGLVAHACHAAMKGMAPLVGPLALEMKVGVQIPVSTAKKLRADMESGKVQPTKRPDLDNIVKGICDGMNGIAYGDDAQIVELKVRKVYAITPGVHVMVRITEGEGA